MESQHPRIIFGGSTIGEAYTTPESVTALLATLQEQGISQIDTAALYPFINMGMSETLLGEAAATESCAVDTKILVTSKDTAGTMAADKIESSITSSKQRLKAQQLNILYCHAPDTATAAEEQLATLDAHYKAGDFKQVMHSKLEAGKIPMTYNLLIAGGLQLLPKAAFGLARIVR